MRSLVVYYSRRGENYAVGFVKEGNAEHIAKLIAKETRFWDLTPQSLGFRVSK